MTSAGRTLESARNAVISSPPPTMPPRSKRWSGNWSRCVSAGSCCSTFGATCRVTTVTQRRIAAEHREILSTYVRQGGDLLLSAGAAAALPDALTGVEIGNDQSGRLSCDLASRQTWEEHSYTYAAMACRGAEPLLVSERGDPLLTVHAAEGGRVIVCSVDHWLTDRLQYQVPEIVHMTPPYRLLDGIRHVLSKYFASFCPVTLDPGGLGVTCCYFAEDPRRMLVGLWNNDLFADYRGTLQLRCGSVSAVIDRTLD